MAISPRLPFLPWLLLNVVVSFGDSRLAAYSCFASGPACEATWKYDAVFVGHIDEISPTGEEPSRTEITYAWRARVRIHERFRGDLSGDVVDVFSDSGLSDSFRFEVGRIYLIYAWRDPKRQQLTASICSRTSLLSRATADLEYLRSLPAENTGLGVIQGSATRERPDGEPVPLVGSRVMIRSAGAQPDRNYHATTDASGQFAVRAPVGKYAISLDVPAELYIGGPWEAALLDARGCADANFSARANGRINGRVLDAHGMPVPYLPVDVVDVSSDHEQHRHALSTTLTDEAGVFEIARLPPSRYKLGVHLGMSQRPAWSFWFPENVYDNPGGTTLGFGERVGMRDAVLPADVVPVLIEGSVADADGRPLTGEYVQLYSGEKMLAMPFHTDSNGRFRLSLIEGRTYRLTIEGLMGRSFRRVSFPEFIARRNLPPFSVKFDR